MFCGGGDGWLSRIELWNKSADLKETTQLHTFCLLTPELEAAAATVQRTKGP